MKSMLSLFVAVALLFSAGCSMEAPSDGVQVKVVESLTEAEAEALQEQLEAAGSGITSTSSMMVNGKYTFNFSPVEDVKAFSDSITFAKVVSVNDRVIEISVKSN